MEWELDDSTLLVRRRWYEAAALPVCIVASGLGMTLFRMSSARNSLFLFILAYTMEGFSFAAYPIALRAFPMRHVMTAWASTCVLTSVAVGWALYGEVPSSVALVGCALIGIGVWLATQ